MNAFEIYEAAFDSAIDGAEATTDYVQDYAEFALDTAITREVAQAIVDAHLSFKGLNENNGEFQNAFYHKIEAPLSAIEI